MHFGARRYDMIIYIVTQGEYSDYGIKAVFTDKTQAMYYCALHNDDYYAPCFLEEWKSDVDEIVTSKELGEKWYCDFSFDGKFESAKKSDSYEFLSDARPEVIRHSWGFRTGYYRVTVYVPVGTTADKVKKIACDRLAQYRAEQMGVL
jgi:hypothetical protein